MYSIADKEVIFVSEERVGSQIFVRAQLVEFVSRGCLSVFLFSHIPFVLHKTKYKTVIWCAFIRERSQENPVTIRWPPSLSLSLPHFNSIPYISPLAISQRQHISPQTIRFRRQNPSSQCK